MPEPLELVTTPVPETVTALAPDDTARMPPVLPVTVPVPRMSIVPEVEALMPNAVEDTTEPAPVVLIEPLVEVALMPFSTATTPPLFAMVVAPLPV